jgi:hypothetical protein
MFYINPTKISPAVIIKLATFVLAGLFLVQIVNGWDVLIYNLEEVFNCDLGCLFYFFPFILIPTALLFFWEQKKIGWILLSIFLTYELVNELFMFFLEFNQEPIDHAVLEILFPTVPSIVYLLKFIFYFGLLWSICLESVREIYLVSKGTMLISIGIVGLACVLIFYLLT